MADPWSILQQALASQSRSTVLKPLGWLVFLTTMGAIAAFQVTAAAFYASVLGGLSVLSVLAYLAAYVYFAAKDPDALRSEKYSIQKMAIQKGFIGDDQTGVMRLTSDGQRGSLPALSDLAEEGDRA